MFEYKFPADGHVTVEDYAKSRKLSKVSIYDHIKRGKLEGAYFKDHRGYTNIDPIKADAIMNEPSIREQMNKKTIDDEDAADEGIKAQKGYTKARTGNEIIKYQMAQIELEEKKGSLIAVDKVRRETFIMARALRDQLMAIPDRNAAIFAAETDERKIQRILLEEIRTALKATEAIIKKETEDEKSGS